MVDENAQNSAPLEQKILSDASDSMRDVLTSDELYRAFSNNLKKFREKRNLSAYRIAQVLPKFSANSIRAWESLGNKEKPRHARSYPRLDALERVASLLGRDVWEFFYPNIEQLEKDLAELRRYRAAREPEEGDGRSD